ncbi:MAG TPA: toll/interleukin-1 receptor domain-containing protein, partial [Aggregatilineaceae bacterium]|nr:toll/interleukin-1 receptor domain-containing protein [Aggregatilineaceae bacterium]
MGDGGIFVSHSHVDREIAWRVARDLIDQKFKVWLDRLQIDLSEDWPSELEEGIDNSSLLLVIWNKNAKESKWVPREIARADKRNIPIIPLLFDDTEVDIHLARTQNIDFRQNRWFTPMQELFVYLNRLVQQEQGREAITQRPWQRVTDPDLRNQFS